MYTSPVVVREFPRGFATRGWDPQNPTGRTNAFDVPKIDSEHPGHGIVWQGMIMSTDDQGKTWKRGVDSASYNGIIAIANNDQLDDDVRNAGTLVGLSCSGQYTYATPYFAHTEDKETGKQYEYAAGTLLTYCLNDEVDDYDYIEDSEVKSTSRSLSGFVRPAKEGEVVIGVVSQTGYGPYNPNPVTWVEDPDAEGRGYIAEGLNRNAIPFKDTYKMPAGVWALQSSIGTAVDSTSKINNSYLLVFETRYTGALAPAKADPGSDSDSTSGSASE